MLSSEVGMNLLPEIRDCVGCEHNHSSLSPLLRVNVIGCEDRTIGHPADLCIGRSLTLLSRPDGRAILIETHDHADEFNKW